MVELIVVITLIGILTGTVISLINPVTYLQRGRDTQRKSDISIIQSAFEIFKADQEAYPSLPLPACGNALQAGGPPSTYIRRFPCDPLSPPLPATPIVYFYSPNPTFSTYCYRACLENLDDKDIDLIKFGADNPGNAATGCNFNIATQVCNPANRRSYTVLSP